MVEAGVGFSDAKLVFRQDKMTIYWRWRRLVVIRFPAESASRNGGIDAALVSRPPFKQRFRAAAREALLVVPEARPVVQRVSSPGARTLYRAG